MVAVLLVSFSGGGGGFLGVVVVTLVHFVGGAGCPCLFC